MNKKLSSEIFDWMKSIVIAVIITICVKTVVTPTFVSGDSMYPTLNDNDFLIVYKLAYTKDLPIRGDIIVFKSELIDPKTNKKKDLIKRVIALPGERITIKNEKVYINGQQLSENYLSEHHFIDIATYGDIDITVPDGNIFVLGDNRGNSNDSRNTDVGTISLDKIIGKASIRIFPFNKIGSLSE